jgi:hypothetical protein
MCTSMWGGLVRSGPGPALPEGWGKARCERAARNMRLPGRGVRRPGPEGRQGMPSLRAPKVSRAPSLV